ncbi:hypothetical protein BO86DRAFT_397118 [Aspergillus japonicus CBS 114.51]|uniref:Uncharacterized protein n=1 Tax=Aspergillus japonicus CBS 114.51 TaxID=1448312 RepID=A0A8T8X9Q7_ASPJA|nr:hypothetical protein BO86DRAFT_397118 [Aspergillus japonicus CBS 114.51]RAH84252.1 hypothetical protein BO86DRAFT_397118 [Aspergillus japonicus CBS 114.51]
MPTKTQTTSSTHTPQSYHLVLTGAEDPLPVRLQSRQPQVPNPPHWPSHYRRVPRYRPVNRNLDPAERPNGSNAAEYIFVNVMLNGVRLNSLFVTSYEKTLGKLYPGLTRYEIGGEW